MEATLEDLTGATLDDVNVDWRNGIVRITFLDSPKLKEACAIRASNFSRVDIPRSSKGESSRRVKSAARSGNTITIVMESGETLRIDSTEFAVDELGG